MKITAAVVREKAGPFIIEELDLDEPRADEILVRMVGCGVCHTDLVARDQYMPMPLPGVFGHEGAGVVEKVGSRQKGAAGRPRGDELPLRRHMFLLQERQADPLFDFFPGNFPVPASTVQRPCVRARRLSMGPSSANPASPLISSRKSVTWSRSQRRAPGNTGALGCGIQTGAGGVINSLKARPGTSIAVFGAGIGGAQCDNGCRGERLTTIIAVDVKDERLGWRQRLGATHTVNSGRTDAVRRNPGDYRAAAWNTPWNARASRRCCASRSMPLPWRASAV